MSDIIGSIITDCADSNAQARQELRFAQLLGTRPTFIGVGTQSPDIEAAGNLVDQLDALRSVTTSMSATQAVILVNVAPRGDKIRKYYQNGTPFCYVHVDKTLIVSTYTGKSLQLLRELGLAKSIELLDIPTVTAAAIKWGELTKAQAAHIINTQFRSFEFLPLVAHWLLQARPVPSKKQPILLGDVANTVWCIDSFGNAKTTLTPQGVDFQEGKVVTLADGKPASCYRRLADVPKNESALVTGSSGYGSHRFLEVVVQWHDDGFHGSDSASRRHGLAVGSTVLQ